jgi:hypothetical protein
LVPPLTQVERLYIEMLRSIDEEAKKNIKLWNELSVSDNYEFGASLCRSDAKIVPSRTVMGTADSVLPSICPPGSVKVGDFHTHGRDGQRGPSGLDVAKASAMPSVMFYVGTPCHGIVRWDFVLGALEQVMLEDCRR